MNEQELDLTLGAIVQSRTQVTAPPILRQHVRAVTFQTPEQRSWLLRPTTWMFRSTFSATRFVIAGAIVALLGGFLLAGVLTQPSEDRLPVVGASASATTQADPTVAATNRPEPTTTVKADRTIATLDLMPGVDLITEQVEPGYIACSATARTTTWTSRLPTEEASSAPS